MQAYFPPFDDGRTLEIARRRGLIADGETLRDGLRRVGEALGQSDAGMGGCAPDIFTRDLNAALAEGRVATSSQILAAAGRSNQVAACTVLSTVGSNDRSRLTRLLAEAESVSRLGMGCGIDLSQFDDPVSALHSINAAMSALGRELVSRNLRPPALMVSCASTHPMIREFIHAKRNANFAEWVTNISVRLVQDRDWVRLRDDLATAAHHNGEPGVLFQEAADHDNPMPELEFVSTAPCAEVFLSPGERCVFLSVNLAAHVSAGQFDWEGFDRSVRLAVRAGDAAVELATVGSSPIVGQLRRIGLGVCGFHSALIRLGIPYAESVEFAAQLSETLTFVAHTTSAGLARRRGAFPSWGRSRWRDKVWVERKKVLRPGVIPADEWAKLASQIAAFGIRNSSVVAYPPTGVASQLLGVSPSYEPHFNLMERAGGAWRMRSTIAPEVDEVLRSSFEYEMLRRQILDPRSGHQLLGVPYDNLLACARQLPTSVHLGVHAAFSQLADAASSKTVNVPRDTTIQQVADLMEESLRLGLKGVSIFRDGSVKSSVLGVVA